MQDAMESAETVIGFAHVYKSSASIADVEEIHPELTEIYEKCHGGLTKRAKKQKQSKEATPIDDPDSNHNSHPSHNSDEQKHDDLSLAVRVEKHGDTAITKEEAEEDIAEEEEEEEVEEDADGEEEENSFIVDDINGSRSQSGGYDGYWYDLENSLSPHKRKRKNAAHRYYWFVDQVFAIEPYEVIGSFGGVSKIYNISKRNKRDAVKLGTLLSEYLFITQNAQRRGDDDDEKEEDGKEREHGESASHSSHENEDDDAKADELPDDEVNTLAVNASEKSNIDNVRDSPDEKQKEHRLETIPEDDEEREESADYEGNVVWLDRTLAKHVGIHSTANQKKLRRNKKIHGWENVLNDFSVLEVDAPVSKTAGKNGSGTHRNADELEAASQENSRQSEQSNEVESTQDSEPPIRSFQILKEAGAIEPMEDNLMLFDHRAGGYGNEIYQPSKAPHIDDSSDSDYLGDEDEMEAAHKAPQPPPVCDEVSKSKNGDLEQDDNAAADGTQNEEIEEQQEKEAEPEQEREPSASAAPSTARTLGGDEDDDLHTVAFDEVGAELDMLFHDEVQQEPESIAPLNKIDIDVEDVNQEQVGADADDEDEDIDMLDIHETMGNMEEAVVEKDGSRPLLFEEDECDTPRLQENRVEPDENHSAQHGNNRYTPIYGDADLVSIWSDHTDVHTITAMRNSPLNSDGYRERNVLLERNHRNNQFVDQSVQRKEYVRNPSKSKRNTVYRASSEPIRSRNEMEMIVLENHEEDDGELSFNEEFKADKEEEGKERSHGYGFGQPYIGEIRVASIALHDEKSNASKHSGGLLQKHEFENEKEAYKQINMAVIEILQNLKQDEKSGFSKKKLRKVVSKKLNISKTQYKHIIDQCSNAFINGLKINY